MKIFDRNIIFLSDIWLCYVYMFTQEPVATTAILICMFQADTVSLLSFEEEQQLPIVRN
jgi:hypothetical protein